MYWNTVTPLLQEVLLQMMKAPQLKDFRLVGGTSLSLQLGHRMSADIDLFTDAPYGGIDFRAIDAFLGNNYPYVDGNAGLPVGMGTSYFVGNSKDDAVKLDLYYTDPFIRPVVLNEEIRLAHVEDIIAMKLDILSRGGRKKDFWDLHMVLDSYDLSSMLKLYQERYPYQYSEEAMKTAFTNFSVADDDFEPVCLYGKHWELIKLDFVNFLKPGM